MAALGWQAPFYVAGGFGLALLLPWLFLVADGPDEPNRCLLLDTGDEERRYIVNNRDDASLANNSERELEVDILKEERLGPTKVVDREEPLVPLDDDHLAQPQKRKKPHNGTDSLLAVEAAPRSIPWRRILLHRGVLAIAVSQFACA